MNTDRHPECHLRTALGNCDPIGGFCTSVNESICEALHKVSRPQGGWTYRDSYWHTAICSNCNKVTMFEEWDEEIIEYDFCPNCGARMKGVDDE